MKINLYFVFDAWKKEIPRRRQNNNKCDYFLRDGPRVFISSRPLTRMTWKISFRGGNFWNFTYTQGYDDHHSSHKLSGRKTAKFSTTSIFDVFTLPFPSFEIKIINNGDMQENRCRCCSFSQKQKGNSSRKSHDKQM